LIVQSNPNGQPVHQRCFAVQFIKLVFILMTIKTDHCYRPLLNWFELTEKEQSELRDNYDSIEDSMFFRYKKQIYDISDFMSSSHFKGWDAYYSDSFFSGLVIRVSDCGDGLKVGTYYS